jgi:hypothetical protein
MLAVIALGLWACATHFGGGPIDTDHLYTARSFLVGVKAEQKGYGLYSYLLFPAPPTPEEKGRYKAAVWAFLAHPPAPAMEAMLPRETLNIFYLMLMDPPSRDVARCLLQNCYPVMDADVEWILRHYNYARAQAVLRKVSQERRNGPYIATFNKPVVVSAAPPNDQVELKALFQDLSSVPPHLVRAWVDLFIENATGKRPSFKQDLRALMLHLETVLENYAQGLPAVIQACKIGLDLTNPSKFK